MKIELKSIKHSASKSRTTHCFTGTVYIDDKRAFLAENKGRGGPDMYRPMGSMKPRELVKWVKKLDRELDKKMIGDPPMPSCIEFEIHDQINEWLKVKELKKLLVRICYVKEGQIYQVKASLSPTKTNIDNVRNTKWWKPEFVLLNELTLAEALKYL